jgi:Ca2+-binding EF-hand superfamily protein
MIAHAALLALGILAVERAPVATPTGDEVQDVVYFHPDRPLILRLRVRLNDRGYHSAWRQGVGQFFRYLDIDNDGVLSPEEMSRGAWLDRMRSESATAPRPHGPLSDPGRSPPAARTPDDLAEVLRPWLPPLVLQTDPKSSDGAETLFACLDLDGDHTLSRSELDAAASTLYALDRDNDEIITASELAEAGSRFNPRGQGRGGPVDPGTAPLALVTPHEPHARLAARIVDRYDVGSRENPREPDHKLARFEIGLDEARFRNADADGDGTLDIDEVSRFLDQPAPDLDVAVNIRRDNDAVTTVDAPTIEERSPFLTHRMCPLPGGRFDLGDDRVRVEFSPGPIFSRKESDVRELYKFLFAEVDFDGSRTVDREEAERSSLFLVNFNLIDRNRDSSLSVPELTAFLDQALALAYSRVLVVVADEGRALFDALDTNHDRRLAARELHSAAERIAVWDLDRDGRLAPREIPQHIRVTFDHAQAPFAIQFGFSRFEEPTGPTKGAGSRPMWFAKMDVNHDGDISSREFVGAPEVFRRLDRDGDGLIDVNEAARAAATAGR